MPSFTDYLAHWQPFFAAVAGVAATLAGLLFVSLSLNREKIAGQKTRVFLRVARRSFGDLLFALFIALLFLMPAYQPTSFGIVLLIPVAFRAVSVIYSLLHSSKRDPDLAESLKAMGRFHEHLLSLISMLGLAAAGIQIYRGSFAAVFWVVPVIMILFYNASQNAWQLLMMEKHTEDLK